MECRLHRWAGLLLVAALSITAAIYWIGLRGGYVYDDFTFLVNNAGIQVTANNIQQWFAAATSFPSATHQGRWMGMLSFAANHFFTGMDPYWFKLTNLVIHLSNGVLLFFALRALFNFHHACREGHPQHSKFDPALAAAMIAALWLVLPINLTGVLYVSQRLESLSNSFVFLGLWWYLRERLALWQARSGAGGLWLALLLGTGIGVLIKESAILLPLYAFSVELALTGFRQRDGRWCRPILRLYGGLLAIPLFVGLVWLAGWVGGPLSYGREFDVPERLMTEGRVLADYVAWTLAPNLDALTLYHDDITVSKSLLDPPITLAALTGILGLIGVAFWKRTRFPLFALGIFWYFGGHLLTATVIPLMLAFEHRNYFPSVGLLLAVTALFALETQVFRGRLVVIAMFCLFSFYAFTTALRAVEWSDPTRLALVEAEKRPRSISAQYARAISLLSRAHQRDGRALLDEAFRILETARKLPGAGIMFEQLLITSHAQRNLPVHREWWDDIVSKMETPSTNASDARALQQLNICFLERTCGSDITPLHQIYTAVNTHEVLRPELRLAYAEFAWRLLGDAGLAERSMREVLKASLTDVNARRSLIIILLANRQFAGAEQELATLRQQNRFGFLDDLIQRLENALQETHRKVETDRAPALAPSGGGDAASDTIPAAASAKHGEGEETPHP